jgi:hypothetical protein
MSIFSEIKDTAGALYSWNSYMSRRGKVVFDRGPHRNCIFI